MILLSHKHLVWHWYCLDQYNVTDENQLLFSYPGSSLKWVKGLIKEQTSKDYDIKV